MKIELLQALIASQKMTPDSTIKVELKELDGTTRYAEITGVSILGFESVVGLQANLIPGSAYYLKEDTDTKEKQRQLDEEILQKDWNQSVTDFKRHLSYLGPLARFSFKGRDFDVGIDPNLGLMLRETGAQLCSFHGSTIDLLEHLKQKIFNNK